MNNFCVESHRSCGNNIFSLNKRKKFKIHQANLIKIIFNLVPNINGEIWKFFDWIVIIFCKHRDPCDHSTIIWILVCLQNMLKFWIESIFGSILTTFDVTFWKVWFIYKTMSYAQNLNRLAEVSDIDYPSFFYRYRFPLLFEWFATLYL